MKHHPPYLPARMLGIDEWERDALIALWPKLLEGTAILDMRQAASDCGSVGCIGGHIALAHGISVLGARRYVQDQVQRSGPLAALYFPDLTVTQTHPGWRASAAQAAEVILGFLTTGSADWNKVMLPAR
jgi:hypothetical protein